MVFEEEERIFSMVTDNMMGIFCMFVVACRIDAFLFFAHSIDGE